MSTSKQPIKEFIRFGFLFLLAALLCHCAKFRKLPASQIKSKIDSVSFTPSSDLLPSEFNSPALENEYYCDPPKWNSHIYVLRVRDNQALIYETYYKPYNWSRIGYRIGNYRISGDTMYVTYKLLLKGKPEYIYLQPTIAVSWVQPTPPEYFLLRKGKLIDPFGQRTFRILTPEPKFELEKSTK